MDPQFEIKGRYFTALNVGWKKNGYSLYDVLDETESSVGVVMVHPLGSLEDAMELWAKDLPH